MSDGDLLLGNVLRNPDCDTARLVYADWLTENGDDEWAEFIRLSLSPDYHDLKGRSKKLRKRWAQQVGKVTRSQLECRRGFVWRVKCRLENLGDIRPLFRQHPIERVWVPKKFPVRIQNVGWAWYNWLAGSLYGATLPGSIFDLLTGYVERDVPNRAVYYATRVEAIEGLSNACVRVIRFGESWSRV